MKRSIASVIGVAAFIALFITVAASALRVGLGIDGEIAAWNSLVERYVARVDARLLSAVPSRERLVITSAAFFAVEPSFPMEASILSANGETIFSTRSSGFKEPASGIDALRRYELRRDLGPHGYVGLKLTIRTSLPSDALLMPALRDAFIAVLSLTAISGLSLILLTRPRTARSAEEPLTNSIDATHASTASNVPIVADTALEPVSPKPPEINDNELSLSREAIPDADMQGPVEAPLNVGDSVEEEARFIARLEGEISRATRRGEQLCLILARCAKGLSEGMFSDLVAKAIAAGAYGDLCSLRQGTFIIIATLPERDAMRLAEALYLSLGLDPSYEGQSIGMSSVCGRAISGKLLIEEAESALEKASSAQGMRLVAFKPDPDKFRELCERRVDSDGQSLERNQSA